MNIAEYTIKKSFSSLLILALVLFGGYLAYQNLGRFEDPEFVIREAVNITPYPGADPQTVANEVTDKIEAAIQAMQEVKEIRSTSTRGLSKVSVEIDRSFSPTKESLEQVWDKLRRKVGDIQNQLPPEAQASSVQDDFADVYALYFAVTGDGYTNKQIQNYIDMLSRELAKVPGVARTSRQAQRDEAVFLDISRTRAEQLGVSINSVIDVLRRQNAVSAAGSLTSDQVRLEIAPELQATTVKNIQELAIAIGDSNEVLRLKDIADIYRSYQTPARMFMYYDGEPAIGFGISNVTGGNVVEMGNAVRQRLAELENLRPVGMKLNIISYQSDSVQESVDGFTINLAAAVAIVFIVLLVFMGVRSGIIIGVVLLLTVAGTLVIMLFDNIAMQRISLGALIIALGMLVDNAIVVTDGILIKLQKGEDRLNAISSTVRATIWPLLGGTVVGILAFSAIGLSPSNMGEYAGSLFWVILYSMLLSWVFAVTATPLLCYFFLKVKVTSQNANTQPKLLVIYSDILERVLHHRLKSGLTMISLLIAAIIGFAFVPPGFVPDSQRPQFVVDIYLPEGTDINHTRDVVMDISETVSKHDGVTNITSLTGAGGLRFMLVYAPESGSSSYGQLLVDVDDYKVISELVDTLQQQLPVQYPETSIEAWPFQLGPGGGKKIEAAFFGPDPKVLRQLSDQAKGIMGKTGKLVAIQDDWREQTPVLKPRYRLDQAEQLGLTQSELNQAIAQTFDGRTIGAFRERDYFIPIILRAPAEESVSAQMINSIPVLSQTTGKLFSWGS